jgi:TetR/AcrR family transcriptional regulator, lmrAB and yxaGH operons repressor
MKDVRQRMITGTTQLLAQRGLQGASFAEVLELTGAPRGSIYHHFPDGKEELVAAALDAVSDATLQRLSEFERDPVAITEGFLGLWSDLLERAKLTAGCAVVAVSVAASGELLDQAGQVFRRWTSHLAGLLQSAGLPESEAVDFATLLISGSEGAVIMSRAERSREPFDRTARLLSVQARRLAHTADRDQRL